MKTILFMLFTISTQTYADCNSYKLHTQLRKLFEFNKVKTDAAQLATVVQREACYFKVNPILVAKIIIIESNGDIHAYNSKSHDYGLMQINESTAEEYKVPADCLLDLECHVHHGVYILAALTDRRNFRPCMWNVGPAGVVAHYKACVQYERKLGAL